MTTSTKSEITTPIGSDEYREINLTIRHYSNMRFLIIPIFFAFNGAIFFGLKEDVVKNIYIVIAIACLSTIVGIVFSVLEGVLNHYMERFVAHARSNFVTFWSSRPDTSVVSYSILVLYASFSVFWWGLIIFAF
jgi:hypothetical protein